MIKNYIISIVRHCKNIYSAIGLLVALVTIFSSTYFVDFYETYIIAFAIIYSLIAASYYSWAELYEITNKTISAKIEHQPACSGFIGDGNANNPCKFLASIEITNNCDDNIYLKEVKIENCCFDPNLIKFDNKCAISIYQEGFGGNQLTFPFEIPPKSKKVHKSVIPFKILTDSAEDFATKLKRIDPFSADIVLVFEDLFNVSHIVRLEIKDDFSYFKKMALAHWEKDDRFNTLLLIAK